MADGNTTAVVCPSSTYGFNSIKGLCSADFLNLDCQSPVHTGCRALLGMTEKYASFPETEEELAKHCDEKLQLAECMDFGLGYCAVEENLSELRQYVDSQRETLAKICEKNGNLRELFLKNGRCLNDYLESSTPESDDILDIGLEKDECEFHRDEQRYYIDGFGSYCGPEVKAMMEELYKPALTYEYHLCDGQQIRSMR